MEGQGSRDDLVSPAHSGSSDSMGRKQGPLGQVRGSTGMGSGRSCCHHSSLRQLFVRSAKFSCWTGGEGKFAFSQDAFDDVVKYFGENPKTTPPSVFFPVFVRFVKAYKVTGSRVPSKPALPCFPGGCPPRAALGLSSCL